MNENQIIIEFVNNGYIVILPVIQRQLPDYIQQAQAMKEVFHGDDVMQKIQQETEPETQQPKASNIFIFKTFPEVISFLNLKFS